MISFLESPITIISLLIFSIILFITVIALIIKVGNINKRYKEFMSKLANGKDLDEMLNYYINRVEEVKQQNNDINNEVNNINKKIEGCFQKIGVVRYNAFKDVGSNLSFVVALLDNNNDGIVLNGIYGMDSSNIYAKPIKNAKSDYKLSDEEINAINIALQKSELKSKRNGNV